MSRRGLPALLALLPALALAPACRRGPTARALPPEDELWVKPEAIARGEVKLVRAAVRDLPQAVTAAGRIALEDLHVDHVFSPVSGRITRVLAAPGQRVEPGTPLVALQSPDVGGALADVVKAQADLEQAGADLARQRTLAAIHAASQRDLEGAQDAERRARAELERARLRAALLQAGAVDAVTQEFVLRSRIRGQVIAWQVNPGVEIQGQYAGGQATELFTIGDVRRVRVEAEVAEVDLPRVRVGAPVELEVPAWPGRAFAARVDWVASTLDPTLRTARIRAGLPNDDLALAPGMYARVAIATPPVRALAIPRQAVTWLGGQAFVFAEAGELVDGRRVMRRRHVRLGTEGGDLVEVVEGVAPGEAVVVDRPAAAGLGGSRAVLSAAQVAAAGIRAEPVEERDVPDAVSLAGRITLDAQAVTHVFSPVNGRVTRVLARPGDRVRRGQPLAALLSPDVGAARADQAKAEADLAQAAHERDRQRELVAAHAGARRDLEAAEDAWRKAAAEADRARQRAALLGPGAIDEVTQEYLVTSPIDGEVLARGVSPGLEVQGQYAGASSPVELFTVGDAGRLLVLADAYEVDLPRLRRGAPVAIRAAAWPGRSFAGRIEWVSPVLDPALRTAQVRCSVQDPQRLLRAEMYEAITVDVPGRRVLAVPRRALLRVGEETVILVEAGAAPGGGRAYERRRVVADEARAGDLVPVSGELHPGDRVVVDGAIFVLGSL